VSTKTEAAEHIIRTLATLGFHPNVTLNAFYIEFYKDYADEQGRRARAIVQFDKPGPAIPEVRLSGFNVVVQAHIEPTTSSVTERAPQVMRDDLLAVAEKFDGGVMPRSAIVLKRCDGGCGRDVNEFFVVAGKTLCRGCRERICG
jgi:hypothetical protein